MSSCARCPPMAKAPRPTDFRPALRAARRLFDPATGSTVQTDCCRSSGVEHSLGKGEVESSNLSGSTILHRGIPKKLAQPCCARNGVLQSRGAHVGHPDWPWLTRDVCLTLRRSIPWFLTNQIGLPMLIVSLSALKGDPRVPFSGMVRYASAWMGCSKVKIDCVAL